MKYNDVGFVEIYKIFVTQDAIFFGKEPFDRIYQDIVNSVERQPYYLGCLVLEKIEMYITSHLITASYYERLTKQKDAALTLNKLFCFNIMAYR